MTVELWQQEAKKLGGDSLVEVIQEIRDGQVAMLERLDQFDKRHVASEDAIEVLKKAFPAGDMAGHCRYHELMIERNAEIRSLKNAIKEKTLVALICTVIAFIGWSVLHEIQKVIKGV